MAIKEVNRIEPAQRETSISAHVVRMASVQMSFAEMDVIGSLLARIAYAAEEGNEPSSLDLNGLSAHDIAILREFASAVDSLR